MKFVLKRSYFYNFKSLNRGSNLNLFFNKMFLSVTNLIFFSNFFYYNFFLNYLNFKIKYELFYQILKFSYYRFSFIVGLWFKKKISKSGRYLYLYLGNRHWTIIQIPCSLKIFPIRKRNVIFFSNKRHPLFSIINIIKNLKLESSYKIMGVFNVRLFRRWLNVRYIRIKFLVTKKIKNKQSFM